MVTNHRGRLLIHAGQTFNANGYWELLQYAHNEPGWEFLLDELRQRDQYVRGGFVGAVDLVDVRDDSDAKSEWHAEGAIGLYLENPQLLEFIPMKGRLGVFRLE
ncbi:MAG: hypothetical protein WBQ23_04530 [Bacteroidota bacterium]